MSESSRPLTVLIIDDERNIRATLSLFLKKLACQVTAVDSADAALAALEEHTFDLAFLDLRLGDTNGLDLVPKLLAQRPGLNIVLVTAYATIDTAVEAIRRGASNYLPKPFSPAQIQGVVEDALRRDAMMNRVTTLEQQLHEGVPEADFATASPRMHAVLDVIARAAPSDAAVLLRGENGTGKGVLARFLHAKSTRHDQPFIVVNCPTLSEDLLASELFGHAKGAFTGAIRDQPGRVEVAEHGTLFLDEIGELSPGLQAKLLRFLQEKQFERIGENRTRSADVRIVAATNRDLEADVDAGRFREDLMYRLNVLEVSVPPLRERPEDILRLARHFVAFTARTARRPVPQLSRTAEEALLAYQWPGNVRELRNAIERAVILWPAQIIEPGAFSERIAAHAPLVPRLGGDFTLEEIEREHILRVVARAPTLEAAARILDIESSTLWRKRKRYEEVASFPPPTTTAASSPERTPQ
jgi:NtrC-family two-component system response regulator AlgB